MARKYLCVYYDQAKTWNKLEDDARGRLLSALLEYAENGTEPNLTGPEQYVWPILADQVDKNNSSYEHMINQRANAGRKSGESRRERNRTKTNENEQPLTGVHSVERKRTSVDNNNNNNNKQFIPPTLEEVKAYIASKGNIIDADYFYEYYSNLDWQDKNGIPVRNWKNRALTWIQKEKERNPPAPKIGRDMTREEIKALYSRGCEPSAEFLAATAGEQSGGLFTLRTAPNS